MKSAIKVIVFILIFCLGTVVSVGVVELFDITIQSKHMSPLMSNVICITVFMLWGGLLIDLVNKKWTE